MQFPATLSYYIQGLAPATQKTVVLHRGLTTLVGPNGSGKTQILRSLKPALQGVVQGRRVRFVSAGRLAHLENFRSDYAGYGSNPDYDRATFGGKEYQQRRHNIETALGDFHTLAARPDLRIKVSERLRRLFRRDVFIEWDAGNLKISFARLDSNATPYSSAREASGLLQLVVLLSALYDNEVGALLLDEPEVSLHPQLQAFLLREIHKVAGDPEDPAKKLILMATHSTEMIDLRRPEDLSGIVFCYDVNETPRQIVPSAGELQNKKVRALLSRLGQEHKLTFFASKPVLLEGPSDAILCAGLDRHLSLYLEAAGAQPLPVIGKGQMPTVVKLMRLIGKSPIVLADADALADNLDLVGVYANEKSVNEAANAKGYRGVSTFARTVHSDFCRLVESNWNDIASEASHHPYWLNRDVTNKDEVLAKRRATLATIMSLSHDELAQLPNSEIWTVMHSRLTALFDFLETAGCFVLRKGTVESYYRFANPLTSTDKPNAAVEEVEGFSNETEGFAESNYADLVRALKFASAITDIDEARALRDLLLSVAAPALANLSRETTGEELNLLARQQVGEKASLLQLDLYNGSSTPELVIRLNSTVLDVQGFPIRLQQDSNVVMEINRQLGMRN
jgi:hypothetical protein